MEINFSSPQEAVFKARYANDGGSLFKSQLELSSELIKKTESFHNKNLTTVRSAVNQIFSGERNLTANLREALFKVIEEKFNQDFDYEAFKQLLIEKFELTHRARLEQKKNDIVSKDVENLLEKTHQADNVMLTTLEPVEFHDGKLAKILKDELLRKVGILDRPDTTCKGSYTFFIPQTNEDDSGVYGRIFWQKLYAYLITKHDLKPNDARERLRKANEDSMLRIFAIDEKITVIPVVFLNYDSYNISGYCVSYNGEKDKLGVITLSENVIISWRRTLYPILNDMITNGKRECKFSDIEKYLGS